MACHQILACGSSFKSGVQEAGSGSKSTHNHQVHGVQLDCTDPFSPALSTVKSHSAYKAGSLLVTQRCRSIFNDKLKYSQF